MPFRLIGTEIPEVKIIEPKTFVDERGFFMETYRHSEFANLGIDDIFVQVNRSKSTKGIIRGLHYQKHPKAQAKLVQALTGEVIDVAVDIRQGAPTFGKAVVAKLTGENRRMIYVPAGFAHGFCVLSDEAEMCYLSTAEYAPECEAGIRWNDPNLAIDWPTGAPQLSKRDLLWPHLKDADNNFYYSSSGFNG
jgi:dTDP-4-dehydrorhamnose 3,5-epimerase